MNVPGVSPNPHETVFPAGGGVEPPAWEKPQPGLRRNLVDARKEQPRRSQAECARGPHVDDKLELGRLLNGQLGRTCALHDPPYIDASCGSAGASRGRAGPPAKICTMPAANPTSTPIFQASP